MPLKIAVYGLGSIGGLLAARLAEAGHAVTGICRGATLAAVRSRGLRVTDGTQEKAIALPVTDDPASAGVQDIVIPCLKANGLPGILSGLQALSGPRTVMVPMVNGVPFWFFDSFGGALQGRTLESVDPGGRLAAAFPARQVVGGVVHISASVPEPGLIHNYAGNRLIVGAPVPAAEGHVAQLAEVLAGAGFKTEIDPKIREAVWAKLAGNMNFNPISALTRATVDNIAADPEAFDFCVATMQEMLRVGDALGLDLNLDPVERVKLALKLGPFRTSMLQDAEAGRRLELGPIIGAVVEIADLVQVPVPQTRVLYGLTRLLDNSLAA